MPNQSEISGEAVPKTTPTKSHAGPIAGKVIYTTNAIEPVHMGLRKLSTYRGSFPSDEALTKLFYLTLRNVGQKWAMPIRDWKATLQLTSETVSPSTEARIICTKTRTHPTVTSQPRPSGPVWYSTIQLCVCYRRRKPHAYRISLYGHSSNANKQGL